MPSASIESSLQLFSLIFDIVAIVRVIYLRVVREYPFFFLFLCVPLAPQAALLHYGVASKQFFKIWSVTEPVRNIIYILVVWELFSVTFRDYAGLRSLSRWVMGGAAAIALLGFVLTYAASESQIAYGATRVIVRYERGITFGLVIFIILLLYFLSKYPITLPRNSVALCMIYSIWFLGDSALLLSISLLPKGYINIPNDGLALLEIGSYIGWTVLLTRAGEYQETRVRHTIPPERERELIRELTMMNEVLVHAGNSISHSHSSDS